MNCAEAREGLWPPERPKLCAEGVVAARRHVDGCEACRQFFAQDRAILDAYARLSEERAPAEVREKVFDALSQARWEKQATTRSLGRTMRRRLGYGMLIAASVILGVISLAEVPEPTTVAGDPAMYVEDYLRRAVGEDHIETDDPEEVVRFLTRELGVSLRPIRGEGLRLRKAEICLFEGKRGALIVYEKDGAAISHYLIPREGAQARAPAISGGRDGAMPSGMPVVTWSTGEIEEALVGEVDAQELLSLAALGAA